MKDRGWMTMSHRLIPMRVHPCFYVHRRAQRHSIGLLDCTTRIGAIAPCICTALDRPGGQAFASLCVWRMFHST
eukprot:scaffold1756_cov117-Isochrysis_galbana.AAC.1